MRYCKLKVHKLYFPIVRREALQKWKLKQGLAATYGNLLELFVKAGHTRCAEALCEVLREKCEWNSSYSCSNCCC